MSYVYAITDKSTILYIGKSINPKNRMREHLANIANKKHHEALNAYSPEALDFYILYTGPEYSIVEEQLIAYEVPVGNKQINTTMLSVDHIQRAKKIIIDRQAWTKLDKDTDLTVDYEVSLSVEYSSKLDSLLKRHKLTLKDMLEEIADNSHIYTRLFASIPTHKKSSDRIGLIEDFDDLLARADAIMDVIGH